MAFNHAHDFSVQNLYAVDNSRRGGESEFNRLKEAACPKASHLSQSDEPFDYPKCHPKTRKAVMDDIMSWAYSNNPHERIMWLNGPAGAGKSAVARTVAERCYNEKKLVSSFFFSRTAPGTGRDDGSRLIPTIAYQLAITIPATKEFIVAELERDPAVLGYSMKAQMQKLVVEPLALNAASHTPDLVIIDGLDECKDREVQVAIIQTIASIMAQSTVLMRFLIASRPELEIRNAFTSTLVRDMCTPLVLDERYNPSKDIETYLRSEFARIKREHTLASYLSRNPNWPTQENLNVLVKRSSGQFIYASTVIKYIRNDRQDPTERLRIIMEIKPGEETKESPYTELDALYFHILSVASSTQDYNSITNVFQALLFKVDMEDQDSPKICTVLRLAIFFGIPQHRLELSLSDLHSIMFVPSSEPSVDPEEIRFFHASFGDFLKDSSRSREFYIAKDKAHVSLGHHCLARILDNRLQTIDVAIVRYAAYSQYLMHLVHSNFHDELLNELRGQDVQSLVLDIFSRFDTSQREEFLKSVFNFNFSLPSGNTDFAIPAAEKLQDISYGISAAVDELLLRKYNRRLWYKLTDPIIAITRARKHPLLEYSISGCWLATILESPERGKQQYLSDERCQNLFYNLWQRISRKKSYRRNMNEVIALEYLLERIKPSSGFQVFLQKELPSLEFFIDSLQMQTHRIDDTAIDGPLSYGALAVNLRQLISAHLQVKNQVQPGVFIKGKVRESGNQLFSAVVILLVSALIYQVLL